MKAGAPLVRLVPLLLLPAAWTQKAAVKSEWEMGAKGAATRGAQDTIASLVSDNAVVIFSATRCGQCQRVKSYFEDEGIPYYALELDQRQDGDALKAALNERAGPERPWNSLLPTVFVRGHLVGGSGDIGRAYKSGELKHWTEGEAPAEKPSSEKCEAGPASVAAP